MSRVIDFALTRDCLATVRNTLERNGSDHMLVIYDVDVAGHRYRVGVWNVERDRKRTLVAGTVARLLTFHKLDLLLLCETSDYVTEFRKRAARGELQLVAFVSAPGQANTCIVARNGLVLTSRFCPKMNSAGWITVRGGKTPPKYLTTVVVDGLIRFAIGQWPPTVHPRSKGPRVLHGPARRVLAYIRHSQRAMQFARRHRAVPLFLAADYNNTPTADVRYAPRWIAKQTGMSIVAPKHGTHG